MGDAKENMHTRKKCENCVYARSACRTSLIGLSLATKYEFQMDFVLVQFISNIMCTLYIYEWMNEWMYMCVNSLNALAQQKKKKEIHFVLFYVYASMIPVLIFSLHIFMLSHLLAMSAIPTVHFTLYTLALLQHIDLCNTHCTTYCMTNLMWVFHLKTAAPAAAAKRSKLTTDCRCNLWGMKTHRTRIIGRSICLICTNIIWSTRRVQFSS